MRMVPTLMEESLFKYKVNKKIILKILATTFMIVFWFCIDSLGIRCLIDGMILVTCIDIGKNSIILG